MFNNLIRQVIYPTAGLRLNGLSLFIMSIISVTFGNVNLKVQFGLSVRYVWKASFIILD